MPYIRAGDTGSGGGPPVCERKRKGVDEMKTKVWIALAGFILCFLPTKAGATTISFDLSGSGYTQDSSVATNLFQGSGLLLSSGVVTACGGQCISSPAVAYDGSITGTFIGAAYGSLEFVGVNGLGAISLYDTGGNLVQTLTPSGTVSVPTFEGGGFYPEYSYSGTTGIAFFTDNLVLDGLIQMSFSDPVATTTPEPSSLAMMLAGLVLLGVALQRKKAEQGCA